MTVRLSGGRKWVNKMSSKKKEKIKLTCIGASAIQVTGSCWVLNYRKDNGEYATQVIECGLPQGDNTILESYNSMKRMYDAVKGGGYISECNNLFLLHSH